MGLLTWIKGKKEKDPRANHDFDDEDRQMSRISKLDKAIKKQELDDLEAELAHIRAQQEKESRRRMIERHKEAIEDYYAEDEDWADDEVPAAPGMSMEDQLFATLLSRAFPQGAQAAAPVPPGQTTLPASGPKTSYTDEELRSMKARLPQEYISRFKNIPDQMKVKVVMDQLPDVDNETVKRAVMIMEE